MSKAKNLPASTPIYIDGGSLFDRLRKIESEIPPGDYGMWFSSEGDDTFSRSDTFEAIDRIYRAAAGQEEAALAEILAHLGDANSESLRMPLPESPLVVPALVAASNADAGLCILISASKKKGFAFISLALQRLRRVSSC